MICTRSLGAPDAPTPPWIGAPCPDCGHSTLTHPGPANPALAACIVCQAAAANDELRARVSDLAAAVGVVLEPWQLDTAVAVIAKDDTLGVTR